MTRFLVSFTAWAALCRLFLACTVTPAQHAVNVGDTAQATAEYEQCRIDAKDGGTFASFCGCVRTVDSKHHIDGGPCE